MGKVLIAGEAHIREIRQLLTSIEFALIPDSGPILDFKPPMTDISLALMHIREKTKKIETEIMADFSL